MPRTRRDPSGCVVARVKDCPRCRHVNPAHEPFCLQCGRPLAELDFREEAAPADGRAGEPGGGVPSGAPEAQEPAEPTQHGDAAPVAVIEFPWGETEIRGDLFVGRDWRSPLADRLQDEKYRYVSRQHAQVFDENGALHVRDMGSKNGTYVNAKRVGHRPEQLFDGDQLRFSRRLVATVRLTAR
jgi:FHA domain